MSRVRGSGHWLYNLLKDCWKLPIGLIETRAYHEAFKPLDYLIKQHLVEIVSKPAQSEQDLVKLKEKCNHFYSAVKNFSEKNFDFKNIDKKQCRVDFMIEYQFKSFFLDKVMGSLFKKATIKMLDAFEQRARTLYN